MWLQYFIRFDPWFKSRTLRSAEDQEASAKGGVMKRLLDRIESSRLALLLRPSGPGEGVLLDLVPILFGVVASLIVMGTIVVRLIGSMFD